MLVVASQHQRKVGTRGVVVWCGGVRGWAVRAFLVLRRLCRGGDIPADDEESQFRRFGNAVDLGYCCFQIQHAVTRRIVQ